MKYKRYTAKITLDDNGWFHGEVELLTDVVTFQGTNATQLTLSFEESIDDYLAFCQRRSEEPEPPLSELDDCHIMYSSDGEGRWWKREWKDQCPEDAFIRDKCQGTKGHSDIHWRYNTDGSLVWSENKAEMTEAELADQTRGCSGSTPPGHANWISPVDKAKDYYMEFYEDSDVTDPEIIAALERDEPPEKGASTNRPCTETEELKLQGRIPKRESGET